MGARLGQHFLFDPAILRRIADAALLTPGDVVLEIGPGRGTLTRELAGRAGQVIAIEADRRLAADLAARPPGPNVVVIAGDCLRVEWPRASVIAGNIPYQITSPLLERALRPPRPARIVFLGPRDLADRLAARPGERAYGALTAGVRLVADVERLFSVRAGAFRPPPRVESAVVRLTPRAIGAAATPELEAATRALIRVAFQHRRRQLQRTLRETYGLSPATATTLLAAAGAQPAARPEALAPEQFVQLARSLPIA